MASDHITSLGFRCMDTEVTFRVIDPLPSAGEALAAARDVFTELASSCTRFDARSPLMRANAAPDKWHCVPRVLGESVREAHRAYLETGGLFDPRVYDALVELGYDRTFSLVSDRSASAPPLAASATESGVRPWSPQWTRTDGRDHVQLGGRRIDLGGIGKGLAVRWAAELLRHVGSAAMVEAGGDCRFIGDGPDGSGWKVGLEDPHDGIDPLAVFSLSDTGCATSSVRRRRWSVGGDEVHHLIDPRTFRSGGNGMASVTVIHPDPAWAEVWSKALFLSGPNEIDALAAERKLAAAWVTSKGGLHINDLAAAAVIWETSDV
jgi:thiamine biosynthesis lipoprotein